MRVGSLVYATHQGGHFPGVYYILNRLNGKKYIGSSTGSVARRLRQHRSMLRAGRHDNGHLQAAWDKYGEASFKLVVFKRCLPDECTAIEQYYLSQLKLSDRRYGYNQRPIAENQTGLKHREDTKAVLSQKLKAYWQSLSREKREAFSAMQKRRKASPETLARMREVSTGRFHSEATKRKMSVVQKAKMKRLWADPEYRAKMLTARHRRIARKQKEHL